MNNNWSRIKRKLHDTVREFYFGSGTGKFDHFVRWTLAPLTGSYAFARFLHQTYRYRRRQTVEVPVVSIGNISIGGTGKTPFVSWLIGELMNRNLQPGLLKRGEGQTSGLVPESPDGASGIAQKYGDEATLLRQRYPEIPIFVGKNRVAGARELQKSNTLDLLLLDDGFQYRCLQRDLDVVLLRPSDYRNGWQLPSGPLREPLSALGRADFVSLYGLDPVDEEIGDTIPSAPRKLFHSYEFSHINQNGQEVSEEFRRNEVVLVTTLARPGSLEKFLNQHGFSLKRHVSLPDHSVPTQAVRETLNREQPVLVTVKEWVKLPPGLRKRVGVIRSTMNVTPDEPLLRAIIESLEN